MNKKLIIVHVTILVIQIIIAAYTLYYIPNVRPAYNVIECRERQIALHYHELYPDQNYPPGVREKDFPRNDLKNCGNCHDDGADRTYEWLNRG